MIIELDISQASNILNKFFKIGYFPAKILKSLRNAQLG